MVKFQHNIKLNSIKFIAIEEIGLKKIIHNIKSNSNLINSKLKHNLYLFNLNLLNKIFKNIYKIEYL